jgi:hypothetical protein
VRIDGEKFTQARSPIARLEPFMLQVGRRIARIVVIEPPDLLVSPIPGSTGEDAWLILQNKGQVDVPHPTRESAIARARKVAQASRGRVFIFESERVIEDQI